MKIPISFGDPMLPYSTLLKLKRFNTPTLYNGWEQITKHSNCSHFNLEPTTDFMQEMGPTIGYAMTVRIRPSSTEYRESKPRRTQEYREYIASVPGPKIVVVQDLDKPHIYGTWWGEVNANVHRTLDCVATITDGGIRDLDEMRSAGFKAIARSLCVGHANVCPIEWGIPVEVFGQTVQPGQLIHADKHGFLAIPPEDEEGLLEAMWYMDNNECETMIQASAMNFGKGKSEILDAIAAAGKQFNENTKARFHRHGEW